MAKHGQENDRFSAHTGVHGYSYVGRILNQKTLVTDEQWQSGSSWWKLRDEGMI